jgi:hypothetical protein
MVSATCLVHIGICLRIWRAIRERANKLLGRAVAGNFLFEIGQAFDKEQGRDGGHIEVVHEDGLIEIECGLG